MSEELVSPTCFLCGAPYSGGSVLLCSTCDRRSALFLATDVRDAELLTLRLRAAEQRYRAEETPPAPPMKDWGDG